MRRLPHCIVLSFCLFTSLFLRAQACWMGHPAPDSLSHVWFRQAFIEDGTPQRAFVSVASTGNFRLYVNQMNVGDAVCYAPCANRTFDITPYLRPDTNVVALLYAPAGLRASHSQVGVIYYGVKSDGTTFAHADAGGWLCHEANSRMTADGGEEIDGRAAYPDWNAATLNDPAMWLPCAAAPSPAHSAFGPDGKTLSPYAWHDAGGDHGATRVESIQTYLFNETPAATLAFPFGRPATIMPRLTIRDAKPGETVRVNNLLTYICNGTIDEQAFPLFTSATTDSLSISGDAHFSTSQITTLDILFVKH